MLYNLLYPLAGESGFFNLFKYLTFRSGGAMMTALLISFLMGPGLIRWLKLKQHGGQPIRDDGPASHLLTKKGTPTMGGLMMLFSVTVSTILWADIRSDYVWIALGVTLGFGGIGFIDDYLKVSKKNHKGLPGKKKLLLQFLISCGAAYWIASVTPEWMNHHLAFPFLKNVLLNLGLLYIPFAMLVIVGASNAVNLTDGLDGLAIVPIMIAAACFALIAYLVGNAVYSEYLKINFVPGTGELAVFCAAIIGAGLGFLWYNAPPAMVFMGDTGSLAFGGALGTVAVITKHEIVLAIIGGLFVLEAVSVMIQVASFKMTGKRVFRMAPIHHHFEKMGWLESTVVIRFLDHCGDPRTGRSIEPEVALMDLPFAKGKHYAVLGLGKSGRSAVRALLASGAQVTAWDDHEAARIAAQKENAALHIAAPGEWHYLAFAALIASPGIPHQHAAIAAAKKQRVEVINDVELLVRANPNATYVGITGTNGKSTTTTLIAHVLKACGKRVEVGGNLGTPALELAPLGKDGIYVIELSSYQLEAMNSLHVHVAVWMNISPDHIDHHGSMAAYIEAKRHLFDRQNADDVVVIGVDDAVSESVARELIAGKQQKIIPISGKDAVKQGVYAQHGILHNHMAAQQLLGDFSQNKSLQGEHNGQNAAAAYATCVALGCAHDDIITAMPNYVGLPHRMQWLGEVSGVTFINDSKATNADAAEKSLRTFDNIYWILGGVAKEGGIESLAQYFSKIRHAYLMGEATEMFAAVLENQVAYSKCGTLDVAFHAATKAAEKNGGTVLLAPACASFDQFPNFEKRGEAFGALVQQYRMGGGHAATA